MTQRVRQTGNRDRKRVPVQGSVKKERVLMREPAEPQTPYAQRSVVQREAMRRGGAVEGGANPSKRVPCGKTVQRRGARRLKPACRDIERTL